MTDRGTDLAYPRWDDPGSTLKHHFVPASYLRLFVDPATPPNQAPYVWVADFERHDAHRKAPRNAAALTDYNVLLDQDGAPDHAAERMLAEFESDALPVIRQIVSGDGPVDPESFGALNAFVALQFARIPKARNALTDFFLGGVQKVVSLLTLDRGRFERALEQANPDVLLTPEQRDAAYEFASDPANYELSVHSSRSLIDALTLASHAEPVLAQMSWVALVADEPAFITSDNPVSVMNPKAEASNLGHGLRNRNTEVTFPLSPKVCYWGMWDSDLPNGPDVQTLRATADQIRAVNLRTTLLADRQCFAPSETLAREAIQVRRQSRQLEPVDPV